MDLEGRSAAGRIAVLAWPPRNRAAGVRPLSDELAKGHLGLAGTGRLQPLYPDPIPGFPHPSVTARTFVFGVLGGIASGKSEVARLLAGSSGVVLDADRMAREELESERGRARLVERYGASVLGPNGAPDRQALARRLFADPLERRWVEGWIHPAVRVRMAREFSEARAQGVSPIVLDVPLLLENDAEHGLVAACDALVFVETSSEVRERRAGQTRGWPAGELARREAAQLPLSTKRARAHHVVRNEGDREALAAEVRRVLAHHGLA